MPYAKLNASGCEIRKDRIKLRLDLFLSPREPHYQGHKPFHVHFIHPLHSASDAEILADITRCLRYFYAFHQHCWDNDLPFIGEWKKVPFQEGQVRHRFVAGDTRDKNKNTNRLQDLLGRLSEFDIGITHVADGIDLHIGKGGTIDVGLAAEDRAANAALRYDTHINYNNAANDTGTIDTVEAWFDTAQNGNNCRIGTFTDNGSGNFTCHDAESVGEVDDDILQQFTGLTLSITAGEFIGLDESNNKILNVDADNSGYSGSYSIVGDYCDPEDTGDFTLAAGWGLSLYGTGDGAAPTELELRSSTDTDARLALDTGITLRLRSSSDTDARLTISVAIAIAGRAVSNTRADISLGVGVSIELRSSSDTRAAITLTVAEVTELELRSATDTRADLTLATGIGLHLRSSTDTAARLTITVTAITEIACRSSTDTRAALILDTLVSLALRSQTDTRAALEIQVTEITYLECRSSTDTRASLALLAAISLEMRSSTSTRAAIILTISLITEIQCRSASTTRAAIQLNTLITLALLCQTSTRAALALTTAMRQQTLNMELHDRQLTMAMRGSQQ